MARIRIGQVVYYRGERCTVEDSVYDEESRDYSRWIRLPDGSTELIDVKKLERLSEGEWLDDLLQHDKRKWTDQHIGNVLRNLEIDVTREPKYRGVPLRPYAVKGAGQLDLPDLAEIV